MIGNKLEQSIIEVFQHNISSTFSINQVSKILKKSYPIINKKSNFFLDEGVLNKINVGNSYQCYLNMSNDKTRILMSLNEVKKKEQFLSNEKDTILQQEPSELAKKYPIECIILYKKTLLFVTSQKFNHDMLKQQSVLTGKYNFIFMDRDKMKEFFVKNHDFQKYYIVLHNPYRFIELLSELKEKMILQHYGDLEHRESEI